MAAPVSIYYFEGRNSLQLRKDFSLHGRMANSLVRALWDIDVTEAKIMELLDKTPLYDPRGLLWRGAALFTKKGTYPAQLYRRDATDVFLAALTQNESRAVANPESLEPVDGLREWYDLSGTEISLPLKEKVERMRVIHAEDITRRDSTAAWVEKFIREANEAYVPGSYSLDFTALPCYPDLPPVLSTIQLSAISSAVVKVPPFKYVENMY
jgi:hypothetical protein